MTSREWWRVLLTFAYLTGWRIGEIDQVDYGTGEALPPAEKTKGKRVARVELHPVVLDHLRAVQSFEPTAVAWPHTRAQQWSDFTKVKKAAEVDFPGAFHRLPIGFANANVDTLPADVPQRHMRHKSAATTRLYINATERMRRQGTASQIHVPGVLRAVGEN